MGYTLEQDTDEMTTGEREAREAEERAARHRTDNRFPPFHAGDPWRTQQSVNGLVDLCHTASVDAGWWHDIKTGVPLIEALRIVPEKLCLIHSEISEAMEGYRKNLQDDKLPRRPMVEVELADALIRIFDLAGALGLDLGGALVEKMTYNAKREDHKLENRLKADGKKF